MAFEKFGNIEGNNNKIPELSNLVLEAIKGSLNSTNLIKEFMGDVKISPEIKAEVLASSLFSGEGRIESPLSNVEEQLIKMVKEGSNILDDSNLPQHLC